LSSLREVVHFRDLLYMLTWRDICIRYKQTILGVLWAILMPAVIVLAGVVVRLAMARVSGTELVRRDLALVLVKSAPWAFFVSSIRLCTSCLVGNSNLVSKVKFPKVILPMAALLSQLFDFVIACVAVFVVLACLGVKLTLTFAWVPVLLFLLLALASGLGIFLAAAGLFFRDVKYMVEIFVTFAVFFTPVFYEVALFGEWGNLLLLNPLSPILEGLASVVVDQAAPNLTWLAYSTVVSLSILGGAYAFFQRFEPAFAESI
jgi:lipopolysaccharide transport system permease protein